jgi:ribose transport system ATP-binding protein
MTSARPTQHSGRARSAAHEPGEAGNGSQAAAPGRPAAALELTGVSKAYPGVTALRDVDLVCHAGEVHALVGENGSGKSTLTKVASGAVSADAGLIRVGGAAVPRPSVPTMRALGVQTAYQDTALVPQLSVRDNLRLAVGGSARGLEQGLTALAEFEFPFPADARIGGLSPGARQLFEVLRALLQQPRVLILDEPTAALDARHVGLLEALVGEAVERDVAVLYISHRLDEVRRLADRLTVLRDGVIRGTFAKDEIASANIVNLMAGRPISLAFPAKRDVARIAETPEGAADGLRVCALSGPRFGPVSFEVRPGEVVGLAGAEGNGQRELARALAGVVRGTGAVVLRGRPVDVSNPRRARRGGVDFISGDRAAESVFGALPVRENLTLVLGRQLGPAGLVLPRREAGSYQRIADALRIRAVSPFVPISMLSGGNQQKAVIGRAIAQPTAVVVADEPTQGVDAAARVEIYSALRSRADAGAAVVVCSSDAQELAGLCDRVLAMSRGRVVRELSGDALTENAIVDAFVSAGFGEPPVADESSDRTVQVATGTPGRLDEVGDDRGAVADRAGEAPGGQRPAATQSAWRRGLGGWAAGGVPYWASLASVALLVVACASYAASRSSAFLTAINIGHWLVLCAPLAVVAMGQQLALITGGFDISVGSTMTLSVVLASYWIASGSGFGMTFGIVGCLAAGVAVGLLNGFVVQILKVNAVVATIATMGLIQGINVLLRPQPTGAIDPALLTAFNKTLLDVPVVFLAAAVIAVAADLWRARSYRGLLARASGFAEESTRRTGHRTILVKVGGYLGSGVLAAAAGLLLAAQVGIGSNSVGTGYTLLSFAACFLGGAALSGGRGSFVGALLGAMLLSLLTNITPLINVSDAVSQLVTGIVTILAVLVYTVGARTSG